MKYALFALAWGIYFFFTPIAALFAALFVAAALSIKK
jgi:hypothetical protein